MVNCVKGEFRHEQKSGGRIYVSEKLISDSKFPFEDGKDIILFFDDAEKSLAAVDPELLKGKGLDTDNIQNGSNYDLDIDFEVRG